MEEIKILKKHLPDCEVTTDLIVGFPTETEEEFLDTLSLVEEADFLSAFTFVYSPRTGTKAAQMEGQIDEETQKSRIMRLVEAVNRNTREKSNRAVGKEITVLCEGYDEKRKLYLGRDKYGRMGYFHSEQSRVGEFIRLRVNEANGISLYCEEIKEGE